MIAAREEKYSILRVEAGLGRLQTRHHSAVIIGVRPGADALKGWRRIDQQGAYGGTFCLEGPGQR